MNKLGLLLCFLLIVNISAEEGENVGKFYDIIVNILKGMSENEEGKCANIFKNKRGEILPLIKDLASEFKNGKSLPELVSSYGFRLLAIEDLAVECKAFSLFEIFTKVTSKEGIKDIGISIQKNADQIYKFTTDLKSTKDNVERLAIIGKIFALVLDFKVY